MMTKAQVFSITEHGITVTILKGIWRHHVCTNLPPRDDVEEGQFVDVLVHASGQRAEWPPIG